MRLNRRPGARRTKGDLTMTSHARIPALCLALTLAASTAAFAMGRKPASPPPSPSPADTPVAARPVAAPAGEPSMPPPVVIADGPAPKGAEAAPVTTQSAVSAISAGEPATPQAAATPSGPQPKIVFEEPNHGFGEVIGAEKIEHTYAFRNDGKADLKVDKVSTTCGCTAAVSEPKVIPPGGKGQVKAVFTVSGRQGKQTKHIYVYSNDPADPKICLTLDGTIIPPLAVEPPSVTLRDTQAESVRTVKISQTMPEELTLKEPVTRLNMVTAALRNDPPENGRKRYTVEIALKPELDPGRYSENVSVETNCTTKPKIDIPVRITVSGDIAASPSRISLGQISPGQEITRSITVASTRDKEFKVLKVEADNPAFTVIPSAPSETAKSFTFTVKGTPVSTTGGVRAKITITTDHPKHKTIEVPIYGWLRVERTPAPRPEAVQGIPTPPFAGQ